MIKKSVYEEALKVERNVFNTLNYDFKASPFYNTNFYNKRYLPLDLLPVISEFEGLQYQTFQEVIQKVALPKMVDGLEIYQLKIGALTEKLQKKMVAQTEEQIRLTPIITKLDRYVNFIHSEIKKRKSNSTYRDKYKVKCNHKINHVHSRR